MLTTIDLLPGITLRCFPDQRFKQENLSLQLIRPMCRQEASLNALLPTVLLRGCRTAPDLRAITQRLDDLYGAAVGTLLRRVGDLQTTGFGCSFMKEQFALQGDAIFAPMLTFLQELLLDPLTEAGIFCKEYVESEKRNLLSAMAAIRNDKRAYAAAQMLKVMCKGDSFGIPRLGEETDVQAITPEQLYDHYQTILQQSHIHLFYVGSQDPQRLAELLLPIFSSIDRCPGEIPPQTGFSDLGGEDVTEQMDVAQGKLCMGFVTPATLREQDFVPTQLLNTVFGGGMLSKLFMTIREQMSLCYDISSSYHGSKGILTVSAGIDNSMDAAVKEEVLHQLQLCRQGNITAQELDAAKQALLSQLRSTHDSPGSIEGYYATSALSGLPLSLEEYARQVEQATISQIAAAAEKMQLHTVYFLKGAD